MKTRLHCALILPSLLLLCGHAAAQANYSESFQNVGDGTSGQGGPSTLISRGWIFRNQSNSSGASPYWTEFAGWGQAGSALGHGGFGSWQSSSSRISAWAILPAIPSQRAGDPLNLWTSAPTNAFGENFATLEVRYSPSGGTGTGSSATDVGSFTQLLATIPGTNGHPWTSHTYALPGTGRIAVRLICGPSADSSTFAGSFLLDSLQVGNPPPSPYPIPSPGQTVHWTMSHSPVSIVRNGAGQNPLIPAGGTVIVDPGVQIQLGNGAQLEIAGTVNLAGASQLPIRIRGTGWTKILRGGLMTGAFADVQSFTDLIYGGKASFTDSTFSDPSNPTGFSYDSAGDIGHRFFDGNLDYSRQILSLTRCTFGQGCDVALLRGWLAARDCTFNSGGMVSLNPGPVGGEAMYITGGSLLKNVTVSNAYIDLTHTHDQHRYIGDVSVTGNTYGPGIRLEGGASYLVAPSTTLASNKWPVDFGINSAGILPGSRLPSTGNQFNEIPDTSDSAPQDERVIWADAGIPYAHLDNSTLHGQVTILPGVTVKIGQDVSFFFDTDSNGVAMPVFLGEPERPIRFMPYTPGTRWYSIVAGGSRWFGTRWDWCSFEGGRFGVGSSQLPLALDNCTFRNNIRAFYSEEPTALRKCTFENNLYSYTGESFAPNHEVRGVLYANHPTNPNTFINNQGAPSSDFFGSFLPNGGLIARARHNSLENTDSDVRNNWWGTPSGPREPRNPSGTGDGIFFGIDSGGFILPFLTQAPTTNPPPVVRFVSQPGIIVPGEKILLNWTARDDGSIVSQRVYYSPDTNIDSAMQLLAEIPANARSFEWTAPFIGTPVNGADQFLRVIAVDNLGQEGIADLPMKITNPSDFTGQMTQNPVLPAVLRPGDNAQICAAITPVVGSMGASLELDNDESAISLGDLFGSGGSACTVLGAQIPDVSTDRARIRFDARASLNQVKSFYGPWFAIRPDPLIADAAPTVTLTSSLNGRAFAGGTTIPLAWTASDDESMRSFDIRASLDGGIHWRIVARDLPGTARTYDWVLPATDAIADVRVRIVAKDLRFQNSSAESGSFSIIAGTWSNPCSADFNGDQVLDFFDYLDFVAAFSSSSMSADFNSDHVIDFFDYLDFVQAFSTGC